jgi:hypothetical protein
MKPFLFLALAVTLLVLSCHKEQFYTGDDASLRFSADTISFDTVFTTIGTATQRLMVHNPYNKILKISNIKLAGGSSSPFKLNVDGVQGTEISNVEIEPNDSIYIFVQVLVNPTGQNLPLFIKDSILFTTNLNNQNVKLIAYGQDVHLIKNETIKTQTWLADKPYLIYGNVTVDTLETLTLSPGTVIYMHKLSNLMVKGTLVADGDLATPVTIQGDRLDQDYKNIPGQWGGVYLRPGSKNNKLNYVIIKNGTTGIQIGDYYDTSSPDLEISNSIIKSMSYNSLLGIGARIKAVNCVIADAALYSCCLIGGDYEFYHCTLVNYYGDGDVWGNVSRQFSSAALNISNYFMDTTAQVVVPFAKANFYNSIIYGDYDDEIELTQKDGVSLNYKFNHCLLKSVSLSRKTSANLDTVIFNKSPEFKMKYNEYLELDTLSAAKDTGALWIGKMYPLDMKKVDRTQDGHPDLGAYERVEKK